MSLRNLLYYIAKTTHDMGQFDSAHFSMYTHLKGVDYFKIHMSLAMGLIRADTFRRRVIEVKSNDS